MSLITAGYNMGVDIGKKKRDRENLPSKVTIPINEVAERKPAKVTIPISDVWGAREDVQREKRIDGKRVFTNVTNKKTEEAATGEVAKDAKGNSLGFLRGDNTKGVSFTDAEGNTRTAADSTGNFSTLSVGKTKYGYARNAEDLKRYRDFQQTMREKRGGIDALQGKVVSIGNSRNMSYSDKVKAREDEKAQMKADNDLRATLAEQAAKTTTLNQGDTLVNSRGEVVAQGDRKPTDLNKIEALFKKTDPVSGLDTTDSAAMSRFNQYLQSSGETDPVKAKASYDSRVGELQSKYADRETAEAAIVEYAKTNPEAARQLRLMLDDAFPVTEES